MDPLLMQSVLVVTAQAVADLLSLTLALTPEP